MILLETVFFTILSLKINSCVPLLNVRFVDVLIYEQLDYKSACIYIETKSNKKVKNESKRRGSHLIRSTLKAKCRTS